MAFKPLKKLSKSLKKGFRKLEGNIKRHGPNLAGVAALSLIPGVGGLLGKALHTGGSGFMGGLLTKEGAMSAAQHFGKKAIRNELGGLLGNSISIEDVGNVMEQNMNPNSNLLMLMQMLMERENSMQGGQAELMNRSFDNYNFMG